LNTFAQLKLYNADDGTITPLTSDRYNSWNPAWSRDGKWLYFLSDRALRSTVMSPWGPRQPEPHFDRTMRIYEMALQKGQRSVFEEPNELHPGEPPKPEAKPDAAKAEAPKPDAAKPEAKATVTIDKSGIMARIRELPGAAGNYSDLTAMTKRLCWTDSDRSVRPPKVSLQCIEPGHKPEVETVMSGINNYKLSGDGKKFLVRRGEEFLILDSTVKATALAAPKAIADARVSLSDWTFPVKPRDEFRELFMDAWRLERDYFHDKNMHGADWRAMRDKRMPLVERVTDRAELNDLIAQMVAELSALHIFVRGGDVRRGQDQAQIASPGAQLERDQAAGGYRIVHIHRNDPDLPEEQSPLAKPGVDAAEGDVITHADGAAVLSEPGIGALLRGKAGKQALLRVGARDVAVKPIALNQDGDRRYSEWEYTRRLEVEKLSGGRIGYAHLRAMGAHDISQFVRDYYPVFNRDGLIIDVRHDNGGNIDSRLLGRLMRNPWFYWQPREGRPYWNMQYAFHGHMVVLVDERTRSDGEAFAEGFKRLGLGKVIGTRTWGGEIWLSSSNFLADRGIATAAKTGVYGPEGKWLIEGHGVDPDIVVGNLPYETFKGRDAQLEAAVKHLEALIAKEPRPVPAAPKHPDKSFKY
jgi:tricorn protease